MLCRDCINKTICKHYDYLCQNPHLMLGDCTYFKAINIEPSPIKLEPEPIYHDPKVIPLNKNNSIKEYYFWVMIYRFWF